MQHFVKVIQGYIANQILQVSWSEFTAKLATANDLDAIHRTHADYLNRAIFRWVLELQMGKYRLSNYCRLIFLLTVHRLGTSFWVDLFIYFKRSRNNLKQDQKFWMKYIFQQQKSAFWVITAAVQQINNISWGSVRAKHVKVAFSSHIFL